MIAGTRGLRRQFLRCELGGRSKTKDPPQAGLLF